jgi:hypothetical protein
MPNENAPLDIPGPVERLRNLAAAFREFEAEWVLFRNEELGDFFLQSGLPRSLLNATIVLYSKGRLLAAGLATAFANVNNPLRFPDISHFIRHVEDDILPWMAEFEAVVGACETELAAVLPDFDVQPFCAQWEAKVGPRGPSPWHFRDTIRGMITAFRRQLTLLDVAAKDAAALKRALSAESAELADVPVEGVPRLRNAFYQDGAIWVIAFNGQTAPPIENLLGLHDYAYLLMPRQVVPALDLMLETAKHDPDARRPRTSAGRDRESVGMDDAFNRVLDDEMLRALKEQMTELKKDLARAEEHNDEARIERLRSEFEEVRTSLLSSTRDKFPDERKKVQSAVYKRMLKARDRIAQDLPDLAVHLKDRVSTGFTCIYTPDRDIQWVLTPPNRTPPAAPS